MLVYNRYGFEAPHSAMATNTIEHIGQGYQPWFHTGYFFYKNIYMVNPRKGSSVHCIVSKIPSKSSLKVIGSLR